MNSRLSSPSSAPSEPQAARYIAAPDVANPLISVVIVSFNTRDLLRECLLDLDRECEGLTVEVIVVDNASRDQSAEMVEAEFPQIRLIRTGENLGFGRGNNRAFEVARGRYIVLLNSDAFLKPGVLRDSVKLMEQHPRCGLAGARLISRDGEDQPSARSFPSPLNDLLTISGLSAMYPKSKFFGRVDRTWADPSIPCEVDWVPGAYSVIRKDVLDQVGFFDEKFFLYYEEVDLCKRIKNAGWQIWYWPQLRVIHIGGESAKTVKRLTLQSSGAQLALWRMRSALIYYRKNHGLFTAWLAKGIESGWHGMRALRQKTRSADDKRSEAQTKRDESVAMQKLLDTAWHDTQGGLVSPPQPW